MLGCDDSVHKKIQVDMQINEDMFSRVELLLGCEALERLHERRVIIFGVGGVGSWCAECLVRSGVGHLTMV